MVKTVKSILSITFIVIFSTLIFCIPTSAVEDNLKINITYNENNSIRAKVGDIIKYSICMSDVTEDVLGVKINGFYDSEYLSIVQNSFTTDAFSNYDTSTGTNNCYTLQWTDVQNLAKIDPNTPLFTIEFKVEKNGETDLSYFITDMYGEDMTYLKSYTITCNVSVNGNEEEKNLTPIVNPDCVNDSSFQGSFINYIDGMGENNTTNKSNHQIAKTVEENTSNTTSVISSDNKSSIAETQFKHVTKVTGNMLGSGGDYTYANIIVAGTIILLIMAIIIVILKIRPHKTN